MNHSGKTLRPLLLVAGLGYLFLVAGCRGNALASGDPHDAKTAAAWTQFQDPLEQAFSVAIPQGWTVRGGMFRLGYSDTRIMVDAHSPDGAMAIRLGDVAIPSYVLPVGYHKREGEVYDLGAQARLIVARYRTGPEFAVLYSQAHFHGLCSDPQPDSGTAAFEVPANLQQLAGAGSAGQIDWRCNTPNGPRVAFAFTQTAQSNGIWQASIVLSFIAPPEKAGLARSILLQMASSFQLTPAWIEHQKQMDAEGLQYQRMRQQGRIQAIQQQERQFQAQMQAMQSQVNGFEQHQAAQANQVKDFTNALVGVTPTTDPLTGEQRDVWTGTKSNYWVNGLGQVVNSTDAPSSAYRQLPTPQ